MGVVRACAVGRRRGRLFVEAGPGDVLTKLAKRVVPARHGGGRRLARSRGGSRAGEDRRMTLPVREPWFDAVEVEPGIHVITEPEVHALILANVWLVRGRDRDLLVDTGNGIAALRPFVDALRDDPAKPLVAVATHAHMDHAAGLWEFDERVAHPADAGGIEHPSPAPARQRRVAGGGGRDGAGGVPRDGPPGDRGAVARLGPGLVRPVRSDPHAPGGRGRWIDLGDRAFDVLSLPGHTPGSVGLWDRARRHAVLRRRRCTRRIR